MLRTFRISLSAASLLLCMLCPRAAHASASAQIQVSLVIQQTCEVRTDEARQQAPSIACRHGQAYGLARHTLADLRHGAPAPAHTLERVAGDASAPEVWVVTF